MKRSTFYHEQLRKLYNSEITCPSSRKYCCKHACTVVTTVAHLEKYVEKCLWNVFCVFFIFAILGIETAGALPLSYCPRPFSNFFYLRTRSHKVAEAGLKFTTLLPQHPQWLGLHVCTTTLHGIWYFLKVCPHRDYFKCLFRYTYTDLGIIFKLQNITEFSNTIQSNQLMTDKTVFNTKTTLNCCGQVLSSLLKNGMKCKATILKQHSYIKVNLHTNLTNIYQNYSNISRMAKKK